MYVSTCDLLETTKILVAQFNVKLSACLNDNIIKMNSKEISHKWLHKPRKSMVKNIFRQSPCFELVSYGKEEHIYNCCTLQQNFPVIMVEKENVIC